MDVLPDDILTGSHRGRALHRRGVSRSELHGPLWVHTARGLYAWSAGGAPTPVERILRAAAVLPDGAAVGGWAAALLHGAHVLDGMAQDGTPLPIPLCLSRGQTCRRVGADRVWRSDLAPTDVTRIRGVPVTSVVRTGFDLARWDQVTVRAGSCERSLQEAVVHVDALLAATAVQSAEIIEYLRCHPRRAGTRQARQVLRLVDAGSASPGESRLRVLWIRDARLPAPLSNVVVRDSAGEALACVDLLDPDAAVVGEYDGGYHADAERRAADLARQARLEAAGLQVVRVASVDLVRFRRRTVARLRDARARGLARDRRRDAWVCS